MMRSAPRRRAASTPHNPRPHRRRWPPFPPDAPLLTRWHNGLFPSHPSEEGWPEASLHLLQHWEYDDQRTIGKEGTDRFGLSSIMSLSPNAAMQAVGVESFVAELAGAIGKGKRGDHPISPLDGRHLRSHVFNHPHPFIAQPPPWWKWLNPSVGP